MTEMVELAHKSVKTAIVAMLKYSKQNTYNEKRKSLRQFQRQEQAEHIRNKFLKTKKNM